METQPSISVIIMGSKARSIFEQTEDISGAKREMEQRVEEKLVLLRQQLGLVPAVSDTIELAEGERYRLLHRTFRFPTDAAEVTLSLEVDCHPDLPPDGGFGLL